MHKCFEKTRNRLNEVVASKQFVASCLFLAMVIRLFWIWFVDAEQVRDFSWYHQFAQNIADGKGYSLNGIPTGYWPIGYPGLLGALYYLVGSSVFIGKLLNIALYLGAIFLTYRFSQTLFRSEYAARVTMCLLCFYPNHIAYTALLSSEILFVFLVALSAFLFQAARQRAGVLALSGLCWGMAALTKPQALIMPFLFLVCFSKNLRSFIKSAILVYGMVLITISPWLIRNYNVFGALTLAHTGGICLLDGNNPYNDTGNSNFSDKVNDLLGDLKTIPFENMFDGKEVERDARARAIAIDYIIQNPGRVLGMLPNKLFSLFRSDVEGFYFSMGMMSGLQGWTKVLYVCVRVFAELYYIFLLLLCAIALPKVLPGPIQPRHVGLAVIVGLTLVYLVLFGNSRYHFPMMTWVSIYSGLGAQAMLVGKNTVTVGADKHFSSSCDPKDQPVNA